MHPYESEARRSLARADRLLAIGAWEPAAETYRSALSNAPGIPDAWFNLGYALRRIRRFEEALDAYAEALRRGVGAPEVVHLNRATILAEDLDRDREAVAELQAALAKRPRYGPALLNLGNLHEAHGESGAAAACYRRLLEAEANVASDLACQAMARLLELAPPIAPDDGLLTHAAGIAASSRAKGGDDVAHASLEFAIGRARDSIGDVDGAFAAFARANALAHRGSPPYDPRRARMRTQALVDASRSGQAGTAAMPTPEPLFVCGMFRSGSTMLEQILSRHPSVATTGELDLLPRMAAGRLAPFPASLASLTKGQCAALAAEYHAGMRNRLPHGGRGWAFATDKRPDNYLLIGLLKRLFPGARILHTVRHPLDNALSVYMQHLNPRAFPYAGDLAAIGHHYGEYRRLMEHWKAMYPQDILDFDYDAFVRGPELELRRVLDFLGLPWHAPCLAFHESDAVVRTASQWQVRKPLYSTASGRWHNYRHHLEPLLDALEAHGVPLRVDNQSQDSAPAR